MPKEFEDILTSIKSKNLGKINPKTDKKYTESDCYAIAVSIYKKKYGKNPFAEDKNMNDLKSEFSYSTVIRDIKILDASKETPKKVVIYGDLMNDKLNANNWRVNKEEFSVIADQVKGASVRIAHSTSGWDVIGTGLLGSFDDAGVHYQAEVTDPRAVEKFVSGTWNVKTMGSSPRLGYENLVCTVCGQDIKTCSHVSGQTYDGVVAGGIAKGVNLREITLTPDAAYEKVGSGNINDIMLFAHINERKLQKLKSETEVLDMESAELKTVLAEKDARMNELKASLETEKVTVATVKAEVEEAKKEVEEAKTEVETAKEETESAKKETEEVKASLNKYVRKERTAELAKRVTDKTVIAEILDKNLADDDFKAELKRIDAIQASTPTNAGKGTLPAETSGEDLKAQTKKVGIEMFGEEGIKNLLGGE